MKLPILSGQELIGILKNMGFQEIRQKGSHVYLKHPDGEQLLFLYILELISGEGF